MLLITPILRAFVGVKVAASDAQFFVWMFSSLPSTKIQGFVILQALNYQRQRVHITAAAMLIGMVKRHMCEMEYGQFTRGKYLVALRHGLRT